jgi:hypothetical protein
MANACGMVAFTLVERPMTRALQRRFRRSRFGQATPVAAARPAILSSVTSRDAEHSPARLS